MTEAEKEFKIQEQVAAGLGATHNERTAQVMKDLIAYRDEALRLVPLQVGDRVSLTPDWHDHLYWNVGDIEHLKAGAWFTVLGVKFDVRARDKKYQWKVELTAFKDEDDTKLMMWVGGVKKVVMRGAK